MTKDELNGILKKDGMYLSPVYNGTFDNVFYVVNESCAVVEFNGVDFIFSRDDGQGYGKKIVAALIEYANTPIEERKPKPQLYNVIIAEDTIRDGFHLTAWQKENGLGEYFVNSCVEQHDLLHNDDLKFTVEEIEDLKGKVNGKQKQIIDIGTVKIEDTVPTKIDKKAVPF
jgi:hypothetical protein